MAGLSSRNILIRGAGIIGLSCAWQLARRGAAVEIVDTGLPGRGASWAAAGMLAPAFEAAGESGAHPRLFELCLRSARLWPEFADEIGRASGRDTGYRPEPSLAVAVTEAEAAHLEALAQTMAAHGQVADRLSRAEASTIEPALGLAVTRAMLLPTDTQIDNRAAIGALLVALERRGVRVRAEPSRPADIEIIATGWQTPGASPVKGQMLSIGPRTGHPRRVLRRGAVYVAPKADRVVIGATMEPGASDRVVHGEDIAALRALAVEMCPALRDGNVIESWAGVRPATPDRAPMIGLAGNGRILAAGHYRNGILLAPVTAEIVARLVLDGETDELAASFVPERFGLPATKNTLS